VINNYEYLTFIPARSGSRSIKKKNIQKIGNKTLIEISINFAKKINKKNNFIFVSTDSPEYAKIAKKAGAQVPFLRSKKYSKDNSDMFDAITEFFHFTKIQKLNLKFKYLIILMPTQPFRRIIDIKNGLKKLNKNINTVLSVKNLHRPTELIFKTSGNTIELKKKIKGSINRQFVKSNFTPCGSFLITTIKAFKKNKSLYNEKITFEETFYPYNLDIDTSFDLKLANVLLKGKLI
tara:strand:- start:1639 stop:2343 length:705 start_codon:yes stop_codon:yes gene_type:complete